MSKFGLLGDMDTLLSRVRQDVTTASAYVNNVRRALAEVPATDLDEIRARLVGLLEEAEAKLDGLVMR